MAVKIEMARGNFSALGGLNIFENMIQMLGLKKKLKDLLPTRQRQSDTSSFDKFKALTLGFIGGAECLDDMEIFREDLGFVGICGGHVNAATVYGDFLRSFNDGQIREINDRLSDTALRLRRSQFPEERDFILDIDSTAHEQYGEKMEGLAWNYAQKWCLDSLQAFDQFGFQYWMKTRKGNTFSGNGVSEVIRSVFRKIPRRMHRYLRADSGMCQIEVFRACKELNVGFVITMRAHMYEPLIKRVTDWKPAKNIRFKDNRTCETGSCVYFPTGSGQALRVVFIRSRQRQRDIFSDPYDYAAWVTNIGSYSGMGNEDIIKFYRGRGNAENFIRELKNGFDMHHFPCQKLLANRIYGVIAAYSYNLMRAAAWLLSPQRSRFSKMIRFRMVYLPGQVVKKARYTIIRLSNTHLKEVTNWLSIFKMQLMSG